MRKRIGLPKDFDPDKPDKVRPTRPRVIQVGKRPRVRVRNPLARTPAAKVAKFLEAGKKSQWPKGVSGNPAGRKPGGKGSQTSYREFIEACREASPRALERLREALELPWTKQTARTILTAAALVIERGYGRAVAVSIDATPERTAPAIPLDENYWDKMTEALRESGALTKPLEVQDAEVVEDAGVVEAGATKLIEPPRP